jgi:hypothetical protein
MLFCKINDDLDLLFDLEFSSQRKTYAPQAPPRFASRGLLIAPRSARLLTNSQIYRTDAALSAVGDVFNNLVVDVFCEFHSALCPTGGADPAALTGEGN